MRLSSKLYILTICLCLPILAIAIPPHVKDRPTPKTDLNATTVPDKGESADNPMATSTVERVALQSTSGDTVQFLCGVRNYVFDTQLGNDIWGYIDPQGREYAIAGINMGVAIINVTDDEVVAEVPYCAGCVWKDIKTMGHYAYIVSECNGYRKGIMILDLAGLPNSVRYVRSVPTNSGSDYTSHSISIDTTTGYLYVEGDFATGSSIHIHSLADPENPVYIASFGPSNIHDLMVIDDIAYVAAGYNPFWQIYDMSNKYAPDLLAQVYIPASGYVHNIWPTDDRKRVVTTEETGNKTIKIWNIEDLDNIYIEGTFLGPSRLAHNAHVKGDRVYTSHYESGAIITDISDPANPVIIGQFDTYNGENNDYNGAWGIWPYTNSGLFFVSNIESNVWIVEEIDTVLADTMWIEDVVVFPGEDVRVDVYARHSLPTKSFSVPFGWGGSFDMTLDSVSTAGARTESFEDIFQYKSDILGHKAAIKISSSLMDFPPQLPPGEGLIMSLYFSMIGTPSGGPIEFNLDPYTTSSPVFSNECMDVTPTTVNGTISLDACCIGIRGDVNGDGANLDIVDLTCIVDFLFGSGCDQPCAREADVNGDGASSDIVDLTFLADWLFGTPPTFVSCSS